MGTPSEEVLMLVRRVIRDCGLPTTVLARDADLSRAALNAWLAGVRTPQADSLRQLAEGLDKRGEQLQEMASELRKAAGEDPKEE